MSYKSNRLLTKMIRRISKNDREQYVELLCQFRPVQKSDITQKQFETFVEGAQQRGEIFVFEREGQILSAVTAMLEQKLIHGMAIYCHIEDVIVHETSRGNGIGKRMMQHVTSWAKEQGCYKSVLNCSNDIKHFYISSGFEERGVSMSFWRPK